MARCKHWQPLAAVNGMVRICGGEARVQVGEQDTVLSLWNKRGVQERGKAEYGACV